MKSYIKNTEKIRGSLMLDGIKFYGSATIGSKGQIVIPAEAREELKLAEGEKLIVLRDLHGGGLMILKAERLESMIEQMQSKFGKLSEAVKKHKEKTLE
jgi:AbrB family looped-hinge helix DNA binding protein